MYKLLHSRPFYIGIALLLILLAVYFLYRVSGGGQTVEYVTATVDRGDVTEIVSVSGIVEAENTADLVFPVSGVVAEVLVAEGDVVAAGDTLATLRRDSLLADRQDAVASLRVAQANRNESISGPRDESRAVTGTTIANLEEALVRATREANEKVENAQRTLLSSNLEAFPEDLSNEDAAPTITGTYTCETQGDYVLDVYGSGANSGYSYRLSGLESSVTTAFVDQSGPLGSCGLRIQFVDGERYGNSTWTVSLPNTNGSSYTSNLNTYNLAVEQAQNTIAAAEEALLLAKKSQTLENADPRDEELSRQNASVLQAQARLAAVDAKLADRILIAPFAGTITDVTTLPGETAGSAPIITLLSDDAFELTARIPEIDITKVALEQKVDVTFDAQSDELIEGIVTFISPVATEIDGVAYFKSQITFPTAPSWMRSGLNADIDIIVDQKTNVLRLPRRFVSTDNGSSSVQILTEGAKPVTQKVELQFTGNDGYVAIDGLSADTIVVAP